MSEVQGWCPRCGATAIERQDVWPGGGVDFSGKCEECGYEWYGSV